MNISLTEVGTVPAPGKQAAKVLRSTPGVQIAFTMDLVVDAAPVEVSGNMIPILQMDPKIISPDNAMIMGPAISNGDHFEWEQLSPVPADQANEMRLTSSDDQTILLPVITPGDRPAGSRSTPNHIPEAVTADMDEGRVKNTDRRITTTQSHPIAGSPPADNPLSGNSGRFVPDMLNPAGAVQPQSHTVLKTEMHKSKDVSPLPFPFDQTLREGEHLQEKLRPGQPVFTHTPQQVEPTNSHTAAVKPENRELLDEAAKKPAGRVPGTHMDPQRHPEIISVVTHSDPSRHVSRERLNDAAGLPAGAIPGIPIDREQNPEIISAVYRKHPDQSHFLSDLNTAAVSGKKNNIIGMSAGAIQDNQGASVGNQPTVHHPLSTEDTVNIYESVPRTLPDTPGEMVHAKSGTEIGDNVRTLTRSVPELSTPLQPIPGGFFNLQHLDDVFPTHGGLWSMGSLPSINELEAALPAATWISDILSQEIHTGELETRIQVDGGQLGIMDISCEARSGENRLDICVTTDAARTSLMNMLPAITENLFARGISIDQLNVSVKDGESYGSASHDDGDTGGDERKLNEKDRENQTSSLYHQRDYGYNTIEVVA